jgi:hypothetical protein
LEVSKKVLTLLNIVEPQKAYPKTRLPAEGSDYFPVAIQRTSIHVVHVLTSCSGFCQQANANEVPTMYNEKAIVEDPARSSKFEQVGKTYILLVKCTIQFATVSGFPFQQMGPNDCVAVGWQYRQDDRMWFLIHAFKFDRPHG